MKRLVYVSLYLGVAKMKDGWLGPLISKARSDISVINLYKTTLVIAFNSSDADDFRVSLNEHGYKKLGSISLPRGIYEYIRRISIWLP